MTPTSATLLTEQTFNRAERSGFMSELDSQEWGLCDRYPVHLDLDDDDEEEYDEDYCDERDDDDDEEWPLQGMARLAAEIEAGRAEVPRGWKLDRPGPRILVWTTPSGRRYATTLTGEWLPVPSAQSRPPS
jgi:hypothetical protein